MDEKVRLRLIRSILLCIPNSAIRGVG